ncbi:MAG: glutathione S-transferase family protein [Pseudomonadota bacterium]
MKLYNGFSPNGMRVDTFLKEKGIEIDVQPVDVLAGETQTPAFLALNSLGEIPVLRLDDGSVVTETMAICRYLEALYPESPLLGEGALAQARIEMWNRRIEQRIFNTIGEVGRHEIAFFKSRGQEPAIATFKRDEFAKNLAWLNGELSDGRTYVVNDEFSVVDITGMATALLMMLTGYQVSDELEHVHRWLAALRQRPSFPQMPS